MVETQVNEAIQESVQRDRLEQEFGNVRLVGWLARAGLFIPPWWSPARDQKLRNFWKESDHLSGAMYTMQSKMVSVPFRIVARDNSNRNHVGQAEKMTDELLESAQFGEGWEAFYKPWLEDFLGQDNGGFSEIVGRGKKDGPIVGKPLSIAHLDAARCQRTGNPEYPVIYQAQNGKRYKLHYSRVGYASQMTSPAEEMYGVGFSAISRCINIAQNLVDISRYKQEKLGSRPHRGILVTQGGLDPGDVSSAFDQIEAVMDNQQMARYSKIAVVGSASLKDADLKKIELSSLPDGFDEETSTVLGMATISLAFGVDARELFPALSSATSKADALLQHMKQRKKGPGEIIKVVERMISTKYLPAHLKLVFDYQDDAQDRQVAEIRKLRADRRVQDANAGVINVRVNRENMLDRGEITRIQFATLELEDGRLMDGSSVLALFFRDEPLINEYLDLGTDDPLNIEMNNKEAMKELIREKATSLAKKIMQTTDAENLILLKQALSALEELEDFYDNPQNVTSALLGKHESQTEGGFVDDRVRSDAPLSPKPQEESNQGNRERNPDEDGAFG